jgi:hypothetical protein
VTGRAIALALLAAVAPACSGKASTRRSGDAGPAVVIVDRGASGVELVAEKEPNDDTPQALALPGGVKGAIDKAGDVDRFELEATQAGTLSVKLSGVADADLALELQDSAGAKLAQSDNGPAGAAEGFPNFVVQPGHYRVVVREFVKKPPPPPKKKAKTKAKAPDAAPEAPTGRTVASASYTLEVALGPLPVEGEEIEPNDTAAFASPLALPGSGRGFVGWRKDKDYWKVPLSGVGEDEALSIDVDGVADVALRVAVLDGTEAVLLERQGKAGDAVSLRNVAVRAGEPHYYVTVAATARGNPDEKYEIRASSAPLELDEETEPNDKPATAGPLADIPSDGGTRVGFLGKGDVDLYKLDPADGPRELHLTVEPPPGVDVVLSVVDESGAPVTASADAGGSGAPEKLQGVPVAPKAVLYVKLAAKSGGEGTERYRLRWSAAPAEPVAPVPGIDDGQ